MMLILSIFYFRFEGYDGHFETKDEEVITFEK